MRTSLERQPCLATSQNHGSDC